LQQGEAEFPLGGSRLLSLWGQGRNPAIGRINDQRRARPGTLPGKEHRSIIEAVELALVREPTEHPDRACPIQPSVKNS